MAGGRTKSGGSSREGMGIQLPGTDEVWGGRRGAGLGWGRRWKKRGQDKVTSALVTHLEQD